MSSRTSVVFLALHKGGSSFLARAFAEAIDESVCGLHSMNVGNQIDDEGVTYQELAIPATGCAAVRVYPTEYEQLVERDPSPAGRLRNVKLVAVQRDPRDAAISRYFSNAYSHSPPKGGEDAFMARRQQLVKAGPLNGMLRMAKPTMREFEHFHRILESRPDALVTSYETMIVDHRGWVADIGAYLGWSTAEQEAVFERTRRAIEFPVIGDPTEHVRRITPGNWRKYDRPKLRDRFDELGGDLMTRAGYLWPER